LETDRDEVLAYLRENGREWREDSSNQKRDFARNRIRHELLPSLMRDWNPRLPRALAQTAEWARAEEEYWNIVLAELAPRYIREEGGSCCMRSADLAALPLALQRRLLRFAIGKARGDLRRIDFEHVEAVRRLVLGTRGTGAVELPGVTITRSLGGLRLESRHAAAERLLDYSWAVHPPIRFPIPGEATEIALDLVDGTRLTAANTVWADNEEGYNTERREHLDWDKLPKPLWLRNWHPGDRYCPWDQEGAKKLKTLFQEHKVAAWARHGWPVIAASRSREAGRKPQGIGDSPGDIIVWARQFGTAAEFKAGPESKVVLEITEHGQQN
jgi:tRNA(Ile)-lysidine synthase